MKLTEEQFYLIKRSAEADAENLLRGEGSGVRTQTCAGGWSDAIIAAVGIVAICHDWRLPLNENSECDPKLWSAAISLYENHAEACYRKYD